MMRTTTVRAKDIPTNWLIIDANDQVLGRVATAAAHRLRGKHKPSYAPHLDCGDHIIVINADKLRVTGNKSQGKIYYRHSKYPGGLRETNFEKQQAEHPTRALELAVKGMLPRGPLGYSALKKLRIYAGAEHPHQAQQPQPLTIGGDKTTS